MSTTELRQRLIDKIQNTENVALLEDAYRLLELEGENIEVYKLNDDQKKAVQEAREQIKNGQVFTNEQVKKETDEWLNK